MECQFSMWDPLEKKLNRTTVSKLTSWIKTGYVVLNQTVLLFTEKQRCFRKVSWQFESEPLWMEGCWSAETDGGCAWPSVAVEKKTDSEQCIRESRVVRSDYFIRICIFLDLPGDSNTSEFPCQKCPIQVSQSCHLDSLSSLFPLPF